MCDVEKERVKLNDQVLKLQGGLIALHVALLRQELFAGLIISSPNVEVDPKVAGWFTVRMFAYLCGIINSIVLLAIVGPSCWRYPSSAWSQKY